MSLDLFVKTNDSVDGVDNNNMNRIGDKDNIMDVDNINFETLYFNEGDFYNHEECEEEQQAFHGNKSYDFHISENIDDIGKLSNQNNNSSEITSSNKSFKRRLDNGNKSPIDIKKAIKYVVSAWDKVLSQTIFNCWRDAGILPLDDTDSQDEIEENEREENEYQENEITGETLTEEQIVAILKENNFISDDESDREITSVSSSEVLAAFDKIFIYLEQNKSQDIIDKDLFVKTNDSVDGVDNNNMNRIGDKDNIMDVDNINFETLYFNEGDFYNHEECEGFIEYQIDQDSLYK
ncbi:unnamed protein product [Rhizophagus irregularis]|nr:unnamed protein product [Rhizophagus irregularis]